MAKNEQGWHVVEQGSSRRRFLRDSTLLTTAAVTGMTLPHKALGATPVGANDRIGVGLIGCGGRNRHHARVMMQLKDQGERVEVAAVNDVYRPRAQAVSEQCGGATLYMDHRELLENPAVDVVSIATPDHIHGYQVIDAARAGKDIFCEKPFTHWRQFELTKQAVREVKAAERVFQLGTQGMSDPAWHVGRKLVADGAIGQPIHAECGIFRVGDWGERGMPIDDEHAKPGPDLNWEAFLGDAPERPFDVSRFFRWRMYEDYSGGPVTDLFPHSMTPTIFMLGVTKPELAVATGGKFRYEEREVPDTFNMLVDYPERITVAVLGTQGNGYQATGLRGSGHKSPVIRGWDGSLTFDNEMIQIIPSEGSEQRFDPIPIEEHESVPRHWQEFFECCRTRTQPSANIDLSADVMLAFHMATLAFRQRRTAVYDAAAQMIVL
jgi:predicted dehydrogenase